ATADPVLRVESHAVPVLLPRLTNRPCRLRPGKLAVGVDRVTEVDVEVVPLGSHPPVDLEVIETALPVLLRSRVGISGQREADLGVRRRRWGRLEDADGARGPGLHEAVPVTRAGRELP